MEKAGLIGLVKMRLLPCDDDLSLRGNTFQEAIDRDRKEGLIPFYVSANWVLSFSYLSCNSRNDISGEVNCFLSSP